MSTLSQIEQVGLVPVIVLEDDEDAIPLGRALLKGGLPCAEVTFRTPAAADSIRRLHQEFTEILVGAGTVLQPQQAEQAIDAGAQFVVAPGFNPRVVETCLNRGVDVFPGVCTPTDIEVALDKGLTTLKLFPAEPIGGLEYLKAIAAPYSQVGFIPTGGIHQGNLEEYLSFSKVVACAGTWMVRQDWIASKQFDRIGEAVQLARRLVEQVRGVKD